MEQELLAALRLLAIKPTIDGDKCAMCNERWKLGEDERHGVHCVIGRATKRDALINQIRAALGTEETGEALVKVALNAHRAEQRLAEIERKENG